MDRDELLQLSVGSSPQPRVDPPSGEFTAAEATAAAGRCMHCDCRGLDTCKLRHYAAVYGADPRRYKAPRRHFQQDTSHPEVLFEPGKCIACGLCIEIAASAGETLGLSFIGRGFDVRLSVPLDGVMAEALGNLPPPAWPPVPRPRWRGRRNRRDRRRSVTCSERAGVLTCNRCKGAAVGAFDP